jgi:hypothetical protein
VGEVVAAGPGSVNSFFWVPHIYLIPHKIGEF